MNDIYDHFACFTRLPIAIDDVRDSILESGAVDRIEFASPSMDSSTLYGMLHMFEELVPYANRTVARIIHSMELTDPRLIRMVCCKELLHILDNGTATAESEQAVNELIDNIVLPLEPGLPAPTISDHVGMVRALQVLLPRDALYYLRPKVERGELTVSDVAMLAEIPDSWARLALSERWWNFVNPVNQEALRQAQG